MILISFLITCYNMDEWLLKRCLTSIISQKPTTDDFEIILVDDGSEYFPIHILDNYGDINIRYFRQQNQGIGGARNSCLDYAQGKYCFFVDGDDFIFPNTMQPVYDTLRKSNPDILCTDFIKYYSNNIERPKQPYPSIRTYATGRDYMIDNNLAGGNWLYILKKELIIHYDIRFPEKLFHEDEEFITKLFFHAKKVIKTNYLVYAYYQRADSIVNGASSESRRKKMNDFLEIIRHLKEFEKVQSEKYPEQDIHALRKKNDYLALDFIIKILRSSDTEKHFRYFYPQMRELGIFPLAERRDSLKYNLFRKLSQSCTGRCILKYADSIRYKKL